MVAAGRHAVAELFPRDPARSPYDVPQRRLFAGVFHGVRPSTTLGYDISPGWTRQASGPRCSRRWPSTRRACASRSTRPSSG
ncbi:styrene monooxygenase/indole monooxygenase family protein [Nonomuraea sp. SYSU D8015]|uniref:styrene monooxygenase/indole monooxygenase family protein n=1 Tax=Nonomuraea sp. SYSU D8015 TaxID=2593644 RepID=UPI0016609909